MTVSHTAFVGSIPAVACQFSVMFFPDKTTALQEVVRVLKPGGALVFNLWDSYDHNYFIQTVNDILINLLPQNPPPFFDPPYGYYQLDEVKALLADTGFDDIEISILPRISQCETAREVALGYILGTPVCLQIAERGGLAVEEVVNIVERAIGEAYEQAPTRAKMQALVFKAYRGAQAESQG